MPPSHVHEAERREATAREARREDGNNVSPRRDPPPVIHGYLRLDTLPPRRSHKPKPVKEDSCEAVHKVSDRKPAGNTELRAELVNQQLEHREEVDRILREQGERQKEALEEFKRERYASEQKKLSENQRHQSDLLGDLARKAYKEYSRAEAGLQEHMDATAFSRQLMVEVDTGLDIHSPSTRTLRDSLQYLQTRTVKLASCDLPQGMRDLHNIIARADGQQLAT
mmetsp:Transcript_44868/g.106456  ORF Transcript_44868/g.106456 Transcript_44868/m.106456 type:complete len:225 (+) Transcript_44868:74-748(+)